jgi:hypothetical protein
MGHLFSVLVSDPEHLRCQLHRLRGPGLLGEASQALGLGYFGDGDVLFSKRPGPLGDLDLAKVAGVRSPALIASSQPAGFVFEEDATDPFRFRRWLFAMTGEVEHFDELREPMLAAMPAYVARQILSLTDHEHVFGLFLAELRGAGRLDDLDVPAVDAARCLAQAVRDLDRIAREKDHQTRPAPLAAVASNGRVLVAVRRGQPLHYALLEGISTCDLCELDEHTPDTDSRRMEHRRLRGVAIASAALPSAGFLEVPDGSTVAVGRSLEITVASI